MPFGITRRLLDSSLDFVQRAGDTMRGALAMGSNAISGVSGLTLDAAATLAWSARSKLTSTADGFICLLNAAGDDFTGLRLGGTTASYPMLKRALAVLQSRLADDSAYADFYAKQLLSMSATDSGLANAGTGGGSRLGTTGRYCWSDNASGAAGATDTTLRRSAAGEVGIGNNTIEYGQIKEVKVATVTIDANSAAAQNLYTVPTGKTFVFTRIVSRAPSAAITAAAGTIGYGASANNVMGSVGLTGLAATTSMVVHVLSGGGGSTLGTAASVLNYKATATEGSAKTLSMDVFGYLY